MNYQHYKVDQSKNSRVEIYIRNTLIAIDFLCFYNAPSFRRVSTKSSTKKKGQIVEALASHHAIRPPFAPLEHLRYSLFDESFLRFIRAKLQIVANCVYVDKIRSFDKLDITLKHERVRFDNAISFCSDGPNPKSWNNSACWKMLNERHFFFFFFCYFHNYRELCGYVECRIASVESEFNIVTSSLTSSLRLVIQQWFIRGLTYNEGCFADLSIYLLKICFK